jgi:excisionase family DNA binding protein
MDERVRTVSKANAPLRRIVKTLRVGVRAFHDVLECGHREIGECSGTRRRCRTCLDPSFRLPDPVATIDARKLDSEPISDANSAGQEPPDAPLVLTVQESAKILRVNEKTIYDMVARGELPGAKKVGRSIRISRRVLMRWLSA